MSRTRPSAEAIELLAQVRGLSGDFDLLSQTVAERVGMSVTDLLAMDLLSRNGSVPAGRLARELHVTTGAVTGLVDRLERAGFAHRVADSADRRRVLVAATPKEREISGLYGRLIVGLRAAVKDYPSRDVVQLTAFIGVLRSVVTQTIAEVRVDLPSRVQRSTRKVYRDRGVRRRPASRASGAVRQRTAGSASANAIDRKSLAATER